MPVANTAIQKRAYAYAATFDIPVFIEPTDPWLSQKGCAHQGKIASRLGLKGIPVSAETIAIAQALELIAETGVRAHIGRISSARAIEMIARAKNEHLPVTVDVSAHQLHLTEHDISNFNSDCHVVPPLRTQRDMEALRQAVADGTIDAISSDHQPHDFDAKQSPFPDTEPGISSLETYLPLCMRLPELTGIKLPELITRMSLPFGKDLPARPINALIHGQRQDFVKIKIAHVEAAIRAGPVREYPCDVGDPVEVDIVQDNESVIPGCNEVLLQVVRTHGKCQGLGLHRVFRQVPARATMGNDDRAHKLLEVYHVTY